MALAFWPILSSAVLFFIGTTNAYAQESDFSKGFERCTLIANDQDRLNCLHNLLPGDSPDSAASLAVDSWPLVKTPNPKGGPEAVAIMRTADTAKSDPDLAGLMMRCKEGSPGFEVTLALVRPFPPRSRRDVVVTSGTVQTEFHAEVSSSGTLLVLPAEAAASASGPWQGLNELAVTIRDPEADIRGAIPIGGLAPALAKLSASCPPPGAAQ